MENGKACFFYFSKMKHSFKSHIYATDIPCITLSTAKISAIYVEPLLKKRKSNFVHSHVVAINTYGYAHIFYLHSFIMD